MVVCAMFVLKKVSLLRIFGQKSFKFNIFGQQMAKTCVLTRWLAFAGGFVTLNMVLKLKSSSKLSIGLR